MQYVKNWIRGLPERKPYIEVLTAVLSVPVLVTVIYTNIANIKNGAKHEDTTAKAVASETGQSPNIIVQMTQPTPTATAANSASPTASVKEIIKECDRSIGNVSIASPGEGTLVTANPLPIEISYEQGDHCAIVWSYRINAGAWSEFSDKNISVYNLPSGPKTLEVRIKGIAGGDEKLLTRTFTYQDESTNSPTPTPATTPTP